MVTIQSTYNELIKLKSQTRKAPVNVKPKVGSCLEMCSKSEIHFRTKNLLIHPMETSSPFVNMKRAERKPLLGKMIKEYSRPAADKNVHLKDVRPYETLVITTEYLLGLLDSYQAPTHWPLVYGFIANRFRAIRQDLIVQQLLPQQIIRLLEFQIPFYLNAKKRCEDLKVQSYEKKLHNSEIDECFSRWLVAAKFGGETSSEILEAYVYYYLNNEKVVYDVLETFDFTDDTEKLLKLVFNFMDKNYSQFFQTFKRRKIDYLRNALWIHIGSLRLEALKAFRIAFGAKCVSFPLEDLAEILAFPSNKAVEECLRKLFVFPNGIPVPFSFLGLTQTLLYASQLSPHWFIV